MTGPLPADPGALRACMRLFPTGVAILTAGSGHLATAMVVNSVASASLDPPMMLVSVHRDARINAVLDDGAAFALGFLTHEQSALTRTFAATDRPAGTHVVRALGGEVGRSGVPVVADAAGSVECELVETVNTGDHLLLIGRAVAVRHGTEGKPPQVFYRGGVTTVDALSMTDLVRRS